jgi:iron(III) transport system ATP-binding protein
MTAGAISIAGLRKTFATKAETVAAVDGVDVEVAAGEIVTLLGPSGCGKTTTLRLVAGLERATAGRIAIGGTVVVDGSALFVPPQRRNLGMVFQSYAIWPHMTVLENVAYALEGRGLGRTEQRERALAALQTVQLAHLAERPAPRLSGGQQQRVAIARALAGSPQALLFDEPLSNLDAKLRGEMRSELRRLQTELGMTAIYVTHDQAEALAISDWIVVMRDGRVVERARPTEIYRAPRHVFTAQFVGTTNLVAGTVESVDAATRRVAVTTAYGRLLGVDPGNALAPGDAVVLSVRPEDLTSGEAAGGAVNRIEGRVEVAVFAGSAVEAQVRCGDTVLHCLLGRDADVTPGTALALRFSADASVVLPAEAPAAGVQSASL